MPWWRAALGPDELKELDGAKRLANERFVAKDLKAALRGYDSVVGADSARPRTTTTPRRRRC